MPDIQATVTAGVHPHGYRDGAASTDDWWQYVVPREDKIVSYKGRGNTFRIPGLAGTVGQKLLTLHNATGSTVLVDVTEIRLDFTGTVVKAVTVLPPLIRVHKITVLPTGGTAVSKVAVDSTLTSSSSVTLLQGASVDGTGSTVTATIPTGSIITQEFAPRLITAAGYEMFDRSEYLQSEPVTLRASEGIAVFLDYTLATQNPITDMWTCGVSWTEFTRP